MGLPLADWHTGSGSSRVMTIEMDGWIDRQTDRQTRDCGLRACDWEKGERGHLTSHSDEEESHFGWQEFCFGSG